MSVMPSAVRDERAGARAAARPHRHAVVTRPADEIRHDEEVAGESHLADDGQLDFESLAVVLRVLHVELLGCAARGRAPPPHE